MKPHIKVIQRNGVDVFVTSSMKMKQVNRSKNRMKNCYAGLANMQQSNKVARYGLMGYGYYLTGSRTK